MAGGKRSGGGGSSARAALPTRRAATPKAVKGAARGVTKGEIRDIGTSLYCKSSKLNCSKNSTSQGRFQEVTEGVRARKGARETTEKESGSRKGRRRGR